MFTTGKALRVYLDASGQTWTDVPTYGRVNWPVEQINGHARYVWELHRPNETVMRIRLLWGWLPYAAWPVRQCKICLLPWMCREARWASDWFDALEAGWSSLVEVEL
jgi:hypothetical protein